MYTFTEFGRDDETMKYFEEGMGMYVFFIPQWIILFVTYPGYILYSIMSIPFSGLDQAGNITWWWLLWVPWGWTGYWSTYGVDFLLTLWITV